MSVIRENTWQPESLFESMRAREGLDAVNRESRGVVYKHN